MPISAGQIQDRTHHGIGGEEIRMGNEQGGRFPGLVGRHGILSVMNVEPRRAVRGWRLATLKVGGKRFVANDLKSRNFWGRPSSEALLKHAPPAP